MYEYYNYGNTLSYSFISYTMHESTEHMYFSSFVVAIVRTSTQLVDIKGCHFKTGSCDVSLDIQHEQLETKRQVKILSV